MSILHNRQIKELQREIDELKARVQKLEDRKPGRPRKQDAGQREAPKRD